MFGFDEITKVDPEVAAAMTDELNRQNNNLELIASENIVSEPVTPISTPSLLRKPATASRTTVGGYEYLKIPKAVYAPLRM